MSFMDYFYDRTVTIVESAEPKPNELGIVNVGGLSGIATVKSYRNTLTAQQAQDRYGIDVSTLAVEYIIEYNSKVYNAIMRQDKLIYLMDKGDIYKIERISVYDEFYSLDECIGLACVRSDIYGV